MDALRNIGASLKPSQPLPGLAAGLPREAQALWASFDRLAETDPEEYKRLTSKILSEAAAAAAAPPPPPRGLVPTPGFCVCARVRALLPPVLSSPSSPAAARPPRQPRPTWLAAGTAVFVNACSHERVDAPRTEDGQTAPVAARMLSLQDLLCLNIPLIVAPLRRAAGAGAAVDVLTHPWVQSAATREPVFRREFATFVLAAVADEFCVEWEGAWEEAAGGARYRGGAPEDGVPVPYEPPRAAQSVAEALGVSGKGRVAGRAGGRRAAAAAGAGTAAAGATFLRRCAPPRESTAAEAAAAAVAAAVAVLPAPPPSMPRRGWAAS
jgi:hypothetical protein